MKAAQLNCPRCNGSGKIANDAYTGEVLRERRIDKGMSLREMAGLLNVSAGFLSDLEKGRRAWSKTRIEDFNAILKGWPDSIMRIVGDKETRRTNGAKPKKVKR